MQNSKDSTAPVMTRKPDGSVEWRLNGALHRDGGPAVEHTDGTKMWYRHGLRHRDDGPAVELPGGGNSWFRDNQLLTSAEIEEIKIRNMGAQAKVALMRPLKLAR